MLSVPDVVTSMAGDAGRGGAADSWLTGPAAGEASALGELAWPGAFPRSAPEALEPAPRAPDRGELLTCLLYTSDAADE